MEAKDTKICRRCMFYKDTVSTAACLSPKAPFTDFVMGIKEPVKINKKGDCEFFHKRD